jgi:hypothetical protein
MSIDILKDGPNDVVIKAKLTNRLKKRLKQHKFYWSKGDVLYSMFYMLYRMQLASYKEIDLAGEKKRHWFSLAQKEYRKIWAVKSPWARAPRFGKNNVHIEMTEKQKLRSIKRFEAKAKHIEALIEQSSETSR